MAEATTLCLTTVWALWRPNQSHQNTLHFLNAHIDILNHSPVEHSCRYIPPTTFLLQVIEALEDDPFPVGETVSDIGEAVTRSTVVHQRFSLSLGSSTGLLPIPVLLRSHHRSYHVRVEL